MMTVSEKLTFNFEPEMGRIVVEVEGNDLCITQSGDGVIVPLADVRVFIDRISAFADAMLTARESKP